MRQLNLMSKMTCKKNLVIIFMVSGSFFSFVCYKKEILSTPPCLFCSFSILVNITFGWLGFIFDLGQVASKDLWNFFFNKNGLDAVRNLVQGDRYSPLM